MYNPGSTYRIQFHKDFNFKHFRDIMPYLLKLGIATVYASPVFQATPGSTHGYDVTDDNSINPELGTKADLIAIIDHLHKNKVGWLQDIVPNHMAFHVANAWLMDVMQRGQNSPYATYFDIGWSHEGFNGKLMLPVLSDTLENSIAANCFRVERSGENWVVDYNGTRYPLSHEATEQLPLKGISPEEANKDKGVLIELLERQHYLFCHWKDTNERINYRRFFTINGMICLNANRDDTFAACHALTKTLVEQKLFDGVRVDHIDGIYDPTQYLHMLRQTLGSEPYIVVEKIQQQDEPLPGYWPVQGTTGYDFIALLNNLFSSNPGIIKLHHFYQGVAGPSTFKKELLKKKELILTHYMAGELDNLLALLRSTLLPDAGLSQDGLKRAIALFLIHCPVYRFYSNQFPLDEHERDSLKQVFQDVRQAENCPEREVAYLEDLLLATAQQTPERAKAIAHFFKRSMQFTGPLMAKGVEDTLMYTYNSFLGRNEVGDSPSGTLSTVSDFHNAMLERQALWPYTMNATATHDTKHGEGARARLHAITHMPDEWIQAVTHWRTLNAGFRKDGAPADNDEYFIYQAMVASYPMPGMDADNFTERLKEYIQKALREAKEYTSWDKPDEQYEAAVLRFIDDILKPDSEFLHHFLPVHKKITDAGIYIALSQVVLKCTCPGIPDVYQGCELWDLSMVDPDNRRPVDYDQRTQWLDEVRAEVDTNKLWEERYNGKIKLWLLHTLLANRRENKEFYTKATYLPLECCGRLAEQVIAFARVLNDEWLIVVVPLTDVEHKDWSDTYVTLPNNAPRILHDSVTKARVHGARKLSVQKLLQGLPFTIMNGRSSGGRSAGILMPVSSLPGKYAIGDFGIEARSFVDKLQAAGQQYWQILPLNPVNASSLYSPYSSQSAMAVNPLLVSPDVLQNMGLAAQQLVDTCKAATDNKVDYALAEQTKTELLKAAYETYTQKNMMQLSCEYEAFKRREAYWLNDFALYRSLKKHHADAAWFHWRDEFKLRNPEALQQFAQQHSDELEQTMWVQFITDNQRKQLRRYANSKGVKVFGDLPFYVSYDSVDVWADPEMFSLDRQGNITGVAGVPPDYFSEVGQLWGVPTFNWEQMKRTGYEWWVKRLRRNIELFDVVRIDHFRALETYWEVAAGETTAINGMWKKGPGMEFFDAVREAIPHLPVIAEDLGYEMEDVYALREQSGLSGMKVLQFAFGENMPDSVDAPHNYQINSIVYTGTHDNNTTLGWFRNETSDEDKERISRYAGIEVNEENVTEVLTRIAYASVAGTAILPLQDVLNLDERSRTNTPGTITNNWLWRMADNTFGIDAINRLKTLVERYNRR